MCFQCIYVQCAVFSIQCQRQCSVLVYGGQYLCSILTEVQCNDAGGAVFSVTCQSSAVQCCKVQSAQSTISIEVQVQQFNNVQGRQFNIVGCTVFIVQFILQFSAVVYDVLFLCEGQYSAVQWYKACSVQCRAVVYGMQCTVQ